MTAPEELPPARIVPGSAPFIGEGGSRGYLESRGTTRIELFLVTLLALAVLVPGIWSHSLVDPWETHYSEVARRMLQDDDLIHTQWQNEGFRSKPVLTFWLIASGLRTMGIGEDGGYSGEMVSSPKVLLGVRLPFVLFGVFGLVMIWWMLARLISRRLAWLSLLVIGTTPLYFLIAQQAITDMPIVGCLMGSIACFALAMNCGEEPLRALWSPQISASGRRLRVTSYHLFLVALIGFVGWQIVYNAMYFANAHLARGVRFPAPGVWLPAIMSAGLVLFVFWHLLHKHVMLVVGFALAHLVGLGLGFGVSSALKLEFVVVGAILGELVALALCALFYLVLGLRNSTWTFWHAPTRTTRQVYMYWFYFLVGISVLGKGPPAVAVAGLVCMFYLGLTGQWKMLAKLEIPRGIWICLLVAVPWHVGMYLVDGRLFIRDYFITHMWKRATSGVHGERGTFDFFMSQIGIGLFPWVALLPAAIGGVLSKVDPRTREGRVRLLVAIWAVAAVAFFSAVQTKFHHYIFPALPALGILIAFWLDDLIAGRTRYPVVVAVLAAMIVLLIMRDLMGEQKQLIEMFVYRYDRPWPSGEPWRIDLAGDILGFGLAFAAILLALCARPLRRFAIAALCVVSIAFAYWGTNVYMGHAGKHWGMRDAMRTYYTSRHIYGVDLRYRNLRQLSDEWSGVTGDTEFEVKSFIPDNFAAGMPMTVDIQVLGADRKTVREKVVLKGPVSRFETGRFWIQLSAQETGKLRRLVQVGRSMRRTRSRPWRRVNADRLIAWQLYWRGENFWSGDEIWGPTEDDHTAFKQTDNKAFLEYLKKPGRAGKRYFIITESGRAHGFRNVLPTARGKRTYQVLDRSSNKFTLLSFVL